MAEEGANNSEQNNQASGSMAGATGATGSNPGPVGSPPSSKPFPEPKVLEAVVDPKAKPKEGPVAFSFTNPQAMHQKQAEPTKGDAARIEEEGKKKQTLAELDADIARDEKTNKDYTIDDYKDTAEMFIEGWEAILTFASRMISKDSSDTAYEFSKAKKERLIYQATKVSRKRNWVMPIEYMFLGTLIPATGTILLKASDKRKEYFEKMKKENPPTEAGETKTGDTQRKRGPGRPSK